VKVECSTCAAYEPWENNVGRCHHAPPSGVRDVRNETWTPFPLVEPSWWCLQHRQKAEAGQAVAVVPEPEAHRPAEPSPQAAGGHARMAQMTPEERTAFARTGAQARWNGADPEDDF
jgi:hypothetical protein